MAEALVTIEGVEIRELKKYDVQASKLWKDAGRNMRGSMRSTLIGIFPKLELEFVPMKYARAAQIAGILNRPFFNVRYFDIHTNSYKAQTFYANDLKLGVLDRRRGLVTDFKVNLIAQEAQR